ncbi:AbrB/MazE/SpoVT family DNA-binding domain-containing protein [Candidatus Microgenomates bacterium]|nr:AbrB/MazE/SpoVT family DNA-binding domain-containing protein [Candidatus Microgenomates bacterium]
MELKVIKIGNSLGVIIPKKLLNSLGWKVGTKLLVTWDNEAGAITYRKK